MIEQILKLAAGLGMSEGILLRLAREVAQDGTLLSLYHLTHEDRDALLAELLRTAYYYSAEAAPVA